MAEILARLREIAASVMYAAEGRELETVLQRIAEVAKDLAQTRYAALGVPDGQGGLRYFKTVGMTLEEIARMEHPPIGHGLIQAPMRERHTIRLEHMRDDPRSVGFPANHPRMDSLLGVPVQLGQRLFGVLYLCDKTNGQPFNEDDAVLVETLAGYAALAVAGAEISQQHSRLDLLEERERISMELHDGVIQSLYGVGMQVELLRGEPTVTSDALKPIVDNLNDIIEEIRSYIMQLRRGDENRTVRVCLMDMLGRLHQPEALRVIVDAPNTKPPFPPAIFESICLIINEALSNAIRHAEAKTLTLRAEHDRSYFTVYVQDDGRGFDPNELHNTRKTGGLGLRHMQHRARLYGGEVSIDSGIGQGTTLTIRIPIRAY
jgi:signal transduction histidine kinase